MLASIFTKRPARDFSAFARVSNQSEISSEPSSRAVFTIPGVYVGKLVGLTRDGGLQIFFRLAAL